MLKKTQNLRNGDGRGREQEEGRSPLWTRRPNRCRPFPIDIAVAFQ